MDDDQLSCIEEATNRNRKEMPLWLRQPMTATQLSRQQGMSLDRCSNALLKLQSQRLVRCLNPTATRNRLFWLTRLGKRFQRGLNGGKHIAYYVPDIDWTLYASICFRHRSEVIRSLTFAMQPATLRRWSRFRTPGLQMSSNNVRDVIRYLKSHGIVRPVRLKKKAHPGYELTEIGLHMRRLLLQAEVRA